MTDVEDTTSFGMFFIYSSKGNLKSWEDVKEGDIFEDREIERTDPILVKVVEQLGTKANGGAAQLEIVEIPDDVKWSISDYDGIESIHEVHRVW